MFPFPLSQDEVQAGANALRILQYGYSWNAVDGHTAGPLNSALLTWPALLGKDITLSSIRLTAFFLVYGIISVTFMTVKRASNGFLSLCLTLPLAFLYGFSRDPDFLHYSSELLPTFLLLIASSITISAIQSRTINTPALIICGLALGMAPFAKLQAIPQTFVIMAFLLWIMGRQKPLDKHKLTILVTALVAPGLILMAPLLATQTLSDFYISYIDYAHVYVNKPLTPLELKRLIELHLLTRHTFQVYIEGLSIGVFLLLASGKIRCGQNRAFLTFSVMLVLVGLYEISIPGRPWPHYLTFLFPFLVILDGMILSPLLNPKNSKIFFYGYSILVGLHASFVALTPEFHKRHYFEYLHRYYAPPQSTLSLTSPRLFDWVPGGNHGLLVWGWMPQWYLLSGDTPATRESHTERQIRPTRLSEYYRKRLLRDLAKSKPSMIIDAARGRSFEFNNDVSSGPQLIPELKKKLDAEYVAIKNKSEGSEVCPKIFISQNRYEAYAQSVIKIRDIQGPEEPSDHNKKLYSPKNLDDHSVTEDSCIDYWLAPHNTRPSLLIDFDKPETVGSLKVLNTHYRDQFDHVLSFKPKTRYTEAFDWATQEIKVELLYQGSVQHTEYLTLAPYPYWTTLTLQSPVLADSARFNILSFIGPGAGLNEVKFYRPSP